MTETPRDSENDPAVTESLIKAFGHKLRARILLRVIRMGRPLSPIEASGIFEMPLSNISYHFDVLARLDLTVLHHTEKKRGATEHFYEPNPAILGHPILQFFLTEGACP